MMQHRNAQWNKHGSINMEIEHPAHGWLPYTAQDGSGEEQMQALYDAAAPEAAPYVAPAPTGDQVNAERDRRIAAGASIAVDGYGPIPVTGTEKDQVNLLGRKSEAGDRIAAGQTDPIMPFRDAANVIHMLTPLQMQELANKGMAFVSDTYQVSWDMKDNPPIPADFADDKHWP